MNKYEKWYAAIITNAQQRNLDLTIYVERHHIVPHSLGGSDDATNLVTLTAREHFICHWLLIKMNTGEARGKMINALYMMKGESTHQKRYQTKITSRIYEKLREEYAAYISKKNKGRKQPPEEKAKQLAAQIGRKRAPFSPEWRAKLSNAKKGSNNNMFGKSHSEETRKKMREAAMGRTVDPEVVAHRSATMKSLNLKREKKLCPHCNQLIAVNGYARWHGDNCKSS